MNTKKVDKVFDVKTPKTSKPHVGLELELYCGVNEDILARDIAYANLEEYVNITDDGSIDADDIPGFEYSYGHELRVLAPEDKIFEVVDKLCAILDKWGATTNDSCGFHVHLDMRNRNKERVFYNLVSSQDVLFKLNPECRRENTYCVRNEFKEFDRSDLRDELCDCNEPDCCKPHDLRDLGVDDEQIDGRFLAVNPNAFHKHQTIEVRVHAGTANPITIKNWIRVLLAIVNKSSRVTNNVKNISQFCREFDVDSLLRAYMYKRARLIKDRFEEPNIAA